MASSIKRGKQAFSPSPERWVEANVRLLIDGAALHANVFGIRGAVWLGDMCADDVCDSGPSVALAGA